jgi:ribosomal silencing factor RsfS
MPESPEIKTETVAETENYLVYTAEEPDGETTWNLELGTVTIHFFREEWREFLQLVAQVKPKP